MSGSVLAEWSLSERVMVETATMATEVGCASELRDPEALKRCLRRKSVVELQRAVDKTVSNLHSDINLYIYIYIYSLISK
jgi:hypothetical protein